MGKKSKKGQSRGGNSQKKTGQKAGSGGNKKKSTAAAAAKAAKAAVAKNTPPPSPEKAPVVPEAVKEEAQNGAVAEPVPAVEPAEDSKPTADDSGLSEGVEASLVLFTESQQTLIKNLCSPPSNQAHLFDHWRKPSGVVSPSSEATNNVKRKFVAQLESMDASYPDGGLVGYISNAKTLLANSKSGVNPLEGWKPSVPTGQMFDKIDEEFEKVEKVGLNEVTSCGFVLVAGGLGERLGYGDIKIGLPTEMATETSYIQFYIETILAYQSKGDKKLPLCIMTSGDTNDRTVKLLKENNYFGMDEDQITIVQQGSGVPALEDNDAHIALDPHDRYKILSKPHGHGDIHALLYSKGVAKKWLGDGIKWMIFFQDTNGLAFHTLPLALGVSVKFDLAMNSIAVPRKAKQAIGGITRLENEKGEQRTINVEYNQLDPLLRSSGFPDGDVNDEKTGFSPFPGNINQLLFKLEPYSAALEKTKGIMPEFVNPKYKDAEKTVFKKPTRLECMMQDFPTVLEGEEAKKVGFTSIASDLCFSPVKNATKDGVALQKNGTHPGVAASGEADQYAAVRKIMQSIGCDITDAKPATYSGITIVPGPEIVLKPSFVSCPADYKVKFPNPSSIKISARSSLVINGSGVVIESLDLDGALVIDCEEGASGVISDLVVKNDGWKKVRDGSRDNEIIRMRGYHLDKVETKTITVTKDGIIDAKSVSPPNNEAVSPPNNEAVSPPNNEAVSPPNNEAVSPPNNEAVSSPKNEARDVDTTEESLTEPAPEEAEDKTQFCGGCTIL